MTFKGCTFVFLVVLVLEDDEYPRRRVLLLGTDMETAGRGDTVDVRGNVFGTVSRVGLDSRSGLGR